MKLLEILGILFMQTNCSIICEKYEDNIMPLKILVFSMITSLQEPYTRTYSENADMMSLLHPMVMSVSQSSRLNGLQDHLAPKFSIL